MHIKKFVIDEILIVFILILLNLLYREVNPIVNYMWRLDLNFSMIKFIINLIMTSIAYFFIPQKNIVIKFMFGIILYYIYFPVTVFVNYIDNSLEYSFLFFSSFIISIISYKLMIKLPKLKIGKKINEKYLEIFFILYGLFIILYSLKKYNSNINFIMYL
ncbi:hypothetical protein [Marinitoga lauensis]|uniref:hypothetical protein n=1 Tax=Marinitoga lauensis TaxID=2201189 RepID=UPI0010133408|nr:hypothetical protein [Marinitoga lauensis]